MPRDRQMGKPWRGVALSSSRKMGRGMGSTRWRSGIRRRTSSGSGRRKLKGPCSIWRRDVGFMLALATGRSFQLEKEGLRIPYRLVTGHGAPEAGGGREPEGRALPCCAPRLLNSGRRGILEAEGEEHGAYRVDSRRLR